MVGQTFYISLLVNPTSVELPYSDRPLSRCGFRRSQEYLYGVVVAANPVSPHPSAPNEAEYFVRCQSDSNE